MKQLLILLLATLTISVQAQKGKIFSAATALTNGDLKEARTLIDEAFNNESVLALPKAYITKGDIYTQIFVTKMEAVLEMENTLSIALAAYKKGYELDMAAEKKPGRYKSDIAEGMLNVARGMFEQAITKFNAGDYDAATADFMQTVDIINFIDDEGIMKDASREDANLIKKDALTNAALCALNAQDYDKASEVYEELIKLGFADEKVYANLASIYISKSDFDKAIVVIKAGKELYPENESLAESELYYYIGTDQSEEAISKLLEAIEAKPSDPDLYFQLASAYEKMDQKDKMVETYEKVIEVDPSYQAAYLNLGAHYNDMANAVIEEMNAMDDWQAAVKLEPKRDEWYQKSIPYLEKAYELDPSNQAVKRALERIYANLNMLDKAKEMRGE